MKLELKHLAPYLPYGLKVLSSFSESATISSLHLTDLESRKAVNLQLDGVPITFRGDNLDSIKPILRPLSDLKTIEKEIKLVDSYWYVDDYLTEKCTVDKIYPLHVIEFIPYAIMQVLLKHHFDVFGLIEKGLAIDINTL
tara:strand:+ start:35 stop:454 length:420 start_codon:yes stop_codon:yes gene_type:complete